MLVLLFSILLCMVVFVNISTAFAPERAATSFRSPDNESRELSKIVGVLEGLAGEDRLPEKVIQKLRNMKNKDLSTVSSLCDRISEAGDTARADVSYMLIMAMIFVS